MFGLPATLEWQFHRYSGYKKPFVWRVIGVTLAGRPDYQFVLGTITRRSQSGKFGDFEFDIIEPGLYKVGDTKGQNGYRFVFQRGNTWRYRTPYEKPEANWVARKLQAGEMVEDVTEELIEHHHNASQC